MLTLWQREPAMILALMQAGIALGVAFGLELSNEQMGTLMAFVAALVGFITRSQVRPA